MLCSVCHKNVAVIFTKRIEGDKSSTMEGLCYDCAKKKGINPLDVLAQQTGLSDEQLENMSSQFESMLGELTEGINPEDLEEIENAQGGNLGSIFSNMFGGQKSESEEKQEPTSNKKVKTKQKEKKKSFLDVYGTNLTAKARKNEIDEVVGRNVEIERVIQILNRRLKNNPCLIGEPGVGKTAIANGLAIRIARQQVPAKLLNKEVYLVDMTAIIAGTQFRGQFEGRMKTLIDECKQARKYYFSNR